MLKSLRLRLVVLPVLIVIAGLVGLALFEAHDARERVRVETASGVQLGRILATTAIAHAAGAETAELALLELENELPPAVRHLSLTVERGPGSEPAAAPPLSRAPAWFVRWVDAPPVIERYPVIHGGLRHGAVVLRSSPQDEIAEVWMDWRNEMAILALVSFAIIAVVILAVSLAFRPIAAFGSAFDRMEEGDFAVRVAPSADPQLRRLAERFNRLAASLEQLTSDNRRLLERLMSVQEAERRHIAHELHDEFGPSLFAIRADIGAISRWVRKKEPRFTEIQERLLSISELVAQIQRINSRLLERLRPVVLDQMRLEEALERLADDWRERYPELSIRTQIDTLADPGETAVHALYRAAQECLTNIVRHSGARNAELRLRSAADKVILTVEDDGRGIPSGQAYGFGLLGMAERARAAGGRAEIGQGELGGVRVTVSVRAREGRR